MRGEPGLDWRIEVGRIWEEKLRKHLLAHPMVATLIAHPYGSYGIDFGVKLLTLRDVWIDAKSDIRRDTPNHSIQCDLPAKYARAHGPYALIVFDNLDTITVGQIVNNPIYSGTLPGRTDLMLVPKRDCLPLDHFISTG